MDVNALNEGLQRLFDRAVAGQRIRSAVFSVEQADGSFAWHSAQGDTTPDGPPMAADSPYFVASISKLYLAAVAMLLAERNLLRLDDPITKYLPPESLVGIHTLRGRDRTSEITIRHLLSHTSGVADYYDGKPTSGPSFRERLLDAGDADIDPAEALRIVRDELRPHFPPQPTDRPRVKAQYSDTNFLLLGLACEAATGAQLGSLYRDLVFVPLGLEQTYLYGRTEPSAGTDRRPAIVWHGEKALGLDHAMRGFTEDGIVSTANDQTRFMRALVRGEVFARDETYASMAARWNRVFYPFEYGLGLMRMKLPAILTIGRLPEMVGHAGSTGAWLFHVPELDLLLSGTFNQAANPAKPFRMLAQALRLAKRHLRR